MGNVMPPGLAGFLQADQLGQQSTANNIGVLSRLMQMKAAQQQMENNAQIAPLQRALLQAKVNSLPSDSALRNAQTLGVLSKLQAESDQRSAQAKLGDVLQNSQYAKNTGSPQPDALAPNDAAAIAAIQAGGGRPMSVDVNNPNTVRALAVQANPAAATTEILKQQRPDKPVATDPLTRVISARDALAQANPNSPLLPQYDAYIKKLTTAASSDATHSFVGSTDAGEQVITTVDKQGNQINQVKPGTLVPSWQNNSNIAERQIRNQLETSIKPHTDVMNAYQRFEQIKGAGDNAQANQFLAQQLMQMSKTGQRALPKAELERILGSGDLGNNWAGRAANMVSQMVSGVRTPDIDQKLSNLADAMALSSAQRIGQEMQNARSRTPSGVNPDRVVGAEPRIYGRFIISPTGKVYSFKNSGEAQAKLDQLRSSVGQQ